MSEQRRIDGHTYGFTLGDDSRDQQHYRKYGIEVEVWDEDTDQTKTWNYSDAEGCRDADGCLDFDRFIDKVVGPEAAAYDWGNKPIEDWVGHDDDDDEDRDLDDEDWDEPDQG